MKGNIRLSSAAFYYSAIAAIILFSFFSFSYAYYPFFNSDSALAVLMSCDYHLPKDLYCWGQDRGGTLEMMIAHFFILVFHAAPLITASIIHYLLLIAGLFAAFHFIRKPFYRLALSIAWFFPSHFFIETILYQFGIQFSLFMVAIFFLSKAIGSGKRKSLLLSLSCFFMLLNVWVLDLGLIPVFFLAIFLIYKNLAERKRNSTTSNGFTELFSKKNLVIIAIWAMAGICFIAFAKNNPSGNNNIPEFLLNSLNGICNVMLSIANSLKTVILFRGKPTESIYLFSAIAFFILLSVQGYGNKNPKQSVFCSFFLWQSLFWFLLLLFMKQVLVSNIPVRYFAGSYLSFSVFIMMRLDTWTYREMLLKVVLSIVLLSSILSALYESYFPERLPPMVKNFNSLDTLKPVGIIGSYWNSYVFGAIDPVHIRATPHEGDNVRNVDLAYQTMAQPRLLLIQNEWLENFPDSISQFGIPLMKKGKPFLIGTYISWEEMNPVMACEYNSR